MFEKTLKIALFLFVAYFGGLGFLKPSWEALNVHRTIMKFAKESEGKMVAEGREQLKAAIDTGFPGLAKNDTLSLDVIRRPGNKLSYVVSYEKRIRMMAGVNLVTDFNLSSDAPFVATYR